MERQIKILSRYAYVLMLTMLAGCVIWPHTTERSQEIQGVVLDARTHFPIQDAKIFLTSRPDISTKTDAGGYFRLNATRTFHSAVVVPGADWPDREYDNEVTVLQTNYVSRNFYGPFFLNSLNNTTSGVVFLQPRQ